MKAEKRAKDARIERRFVLPLAFFFARVRRKKIQPHQSSRFLFFFFLSFAPPSQKQAEPWSQSGEGRTSKVRKKEKKDRKRRATSGRRASRRKRNLARIRHQFRFRLGRPSSSLLSFPLSRFSLSLASSSPPLARRQWHQSALIYTHCL